MDRYEFVSDIARKSFEYEVERESEGFDIKDIERMLNPDHMLERIYIGLQRKSSQNLLKRKTIFSGIEKYIYYRVGRSENSCVIMKLKHDMMNALRIDERLAWAMATENTTRETVIENVADLIKGMCGVAPEVQLDGPQVYCVTNRDKNRGAAGVLETHRMKRFARDQGVEKLIVLPSSIHEMLVIPDFEGADMEKLDRIVREVNAREVPVEEQLADRAYTLDFS